jgi:20S proteasome alpha/beta subunit
MFKNHYNTNPIIFSPDGQLMQINFANKAAERGNLTLSFKSKSHIIMISAIKLEKNQATRENRLLVIGKNILMVTTGVSKDGKFLNKILRKKKNENEISSNRFCQIPEIASFCSKIMARNTFYSNLRPFGIQLIIIGYDSSGPLIFDFNNDGSYERQIYSAQGKGSNKILGNIDQLSDTLEDYSTDELINIIFKVYSKSISKFQKNKLAENPFFLTLIGKNLELFILKENLIKLYLENFQKIDYENEGQDFKTPLTSSNFDTDSSLEWSSYESEPETTDDY